LSKFIHLLGKDARLEIIRILLRNRSIKDLAQSLGVTPPAVVKYLAGRTHPSDTTMQRALRIADDDESNLIYSIIIRELASGLEEAVREAIEKNALKNSDVRFLRTVLRRIEDHVGRKLAEYIYV